MAIGFNADEIFSLAEQIERNGAAFYRACSHHNPQAKDFLMQLAVMEEAHEKTFKELHKQVTEQESELLASDPDGQAELFLKNLAAGSIFDIRKNPAETIRGTETLAEVIKIAIGLEKDSVVFYVGMKEMMTRSSGRDKLDFIIKEEMRHIALLSSRL